MTRIKLLLVCGIFVIIALAVLIFQPKSNYASSFKIAKKEYLDNLNSSTSTSIKTTNNKSYIGSLDRSEEIGVYNIVENVEQNYFTVIGVLKSINLVNSEYILQIKANELLQTFKLSPVVVHQWSDNNTVNIVSRNGDSNEIREFNEILTPKEVYKLYKDSIGEIFKVRVLLKPEEINFISKSK